MKKVSHVCTADERQVCNDPPAVTAAPGTPSPCRPRPVEGIPAGALESQHPLWRSEGTARVRKGSGLRQWLAGYAVLFLFLGTLWSGSLVEPWGVPLFGVGWVVVALVVYRLAGSAAVSQDGEPPAA